MHRYRILVVEDDPEQAAYIERLLRQASTVFEPMHAVTLRSALMVLENRHVDLVLLDLSLPDVHGFDTVQQFVKAAPATPFIVLTGGSGVDEMQMAMRCISLGAQDYQLKNEVMSAGMLERSILKALGRSGLAQDKDQLTTTALTSILPPEQATVTMLKPAVVRLVDTLEDVAGFIRGNAPRQVQDDVGAILDKHHTYDTIRDIRRMFREDHRTRRVSDAAIQTMADIAAKSGVTTEESPATWQEAEQALDKLIRSEISHGE